MNILGTITELLRRDEISEYLTVSASDGKDVLFFEEEMAIKARVYGERYPIDEDFLAALALMPPAAGCALGFDRLVMLAVGAPRIADVIWVPAG